MAAKLGVRHFGSGETIFREGDSAPLAYLIESGAVAISTEVGSETRELNRLGPGHLFGEIGLIDGNPRSATATALEDTLCLELDGDWVREHLEAADPGLRLLLGAVLGHFRSETESFRPAEASGLNPPGDGAIREHLESDLAAVREGLVLVGELQQALDGDQLAVHFQPILRTSGRDVVGFEALVRWQHPEKGFIPPDRFIPAAEATGVIHPLGELVAREALRVLAGLRERFEGDYYVSINVAARQVERAGFVEACRGWAEAARVPPTRLKLEILERSLLTGERARRWIDASRVAGFPLVLDDFGTGFSSLASIHEYRVDALKIDRSFINRIESESGGSMCRAIVSLAQALGIECVAEGVETEVQQAKLSDLGCEFVQGYLHARPMPEEALIEWLGARVGGPKR